MKRQLLCGKLHANIIEFYFQAFIFIKIELFLINSNA